MFGETESIHRRAQSPRVCLAKSPRARARSYAPSPPFSSHPLSHRASAPGARSREPRARGIPRSVVPRGRRHPEERAPTARRTPSSASASDFPAARPPAARDARVSPRGASFSEPTPASRRRDGSSPRGRCSCAVPVDRSPRKTRDASRRTRMSAPIGLIRADFRAGRRPARSPSSRSGATTTRPVSASSSTFSRATLSWSRGVSSGPVKMTSARLARRRPGERRRRVAAARRVGFGSAESSARANAPFQGPIRRVPEAPRRVDRFAGVLGANSGRGGVAVIPPERAPGGDAAGRPTGPWRCDSLAGSAPIGAVSASSSTRGRRMVFRWCFVAARRDLRRGEARGAGPSAAGSSAREGRDTCAREGGERQRFETRPVRDPGRAARETRAHPCVLRDARKCMFESISAPATRVAARPARARVGRAIQRARSNKRADL